MIFLRVGQQSEWTLPIVLGAYMNSYEIEMVPDKAIQRYLTYNNDTNQVKYNDLHGSSQLVYGGIFKVEYRIVDSLGNSNSVT